MQDKRVMIIDDRETIRRAQVVLAFLYAKPSIRCTSNYTTHTTSLLLTTSEEEKPMVDLVSWSIIIKIGGSLL